MRSALGLLGIAAALATATAAYGQPAATSVPASAAASECRLDIAPTAAVRPRHEQRKSDRIAAIDRLLAGPRFDVLALGDSITERWPQPSLEQAFPGRTVLNAGVSGDWVSDLLFRLSGQSTRMADGSALGMRHWQHQSPRIVTILIGTNDLRGATPCYIASGIVAAAGRVHTLYPAARVVALGILPRGNPQGQFADEIARVNALVGAEALRSRRFDFVDLGPAFRCAAQAACDVAIPGNYVHPSDTGYARLAAALRARLARS